MEPAAEKTVNIDKKGLTSAAHWQIKRPVLAHRLNAPAQTPCRFRGHSSAGRAPALQAGGRRFDPVWLHQLLTNQTKIKCQQAMSWLQVLPLCLRAQRVLYKPVEPRKSREAVVFCQGFQLSNLLVQCFRRCSLLPGKIGGHHAARFENVRGFLFDGRKGADDYRVGGIG